MFAAALLCVSWPAAEWAEERRPLSNAAFDARLAAFLDLCDPPAGAADPAATVPGGCRLFRAAAALPGRSDAEKVRLRRRIGAELVAARDALLRRGMNWDKNRDRVARGGRPRPLPRHRTFAGPREQAEARKLIALIQATIAPETWEPNGGTGTIRYFDLYQVLVVRAPQRVHGEVGDLLGNLR